MLHQTLISEIKEISIIDYLASLGYQPEKFHRSEYVYYSPIRTENTPSFFVNPDKNLYKDWGQSGGDIIKLVMEMKNVDFKTAIDTLDRWEPGILNESQISAQREVKARGEIKILSIQSVGHPALIEYLKKRRIPFSFAANYLKELHYVNNGKRFFSIGFANDNGGWALRNEKFKNCIGAQGVTYLKVPGTTDISVFEGFFDFLSALVFFNVPASKNSVLVLNSTTNLKTAYDVLSRYKTIHTYLDNDTAGVQALRELRKWEPEVSDKSKLYSGYKDFSEMISNR